MKKLNVKHCELIIFISLLTAGDPSCLSVCNTTQ